MIYVITPSRQDFIAVCRINKLPVEMNFNGLPASKDVYWIHSWSHMLGLKIKKKDQIIYGFRFNEFKTEEQRKILTEIALRQKI